jgi:hypothetical protein
LPARASEGRKGEIASDQKAWRKQYAKLPLSFEANLGQTDPGVKFLSRGSGYTLFLTKSDAVLTLHGSKASGKEPGSGTQSGQATDAAQRTTSVLRMMLAGANSQASAAGVDKLPGKINYFIGNDPKKWYSGIPTYGKVQYTDVYPGIDLTYYGNQGQLEYDFAVSPGASPRSIRLQLKGADRVRVSPSGDLILGIPAGEVRLHKPHVYQLEAKGTHLPGKEARAVVVRHEISGRYVVRRNREIGFEVGAYNPRQTLIIDPVLVYSTYLGGSNDEKLSGAAVTPGGELTVVGDTASSDFPTKNPYQGALGAGSPRNVFITQLSADGSSLVFSTYLGGSSSDGGWGVAIESSGNIYVDGFSSSSNFPVTPTAYQGTLVGGTGAYDIFLSKFDSTGSSLLYSSYIGQMDYNFVVDGQVGLAINNTGWAYVCSATNSSSYPAITPSTAVQPTLGGADSGVLTILDTTKSGSNSLVYGTFLGGSSPSSAVTSMLNVAVDSSGNVYATGYTRSANFPTTSGAFQASCPGTCTDNAYVAKINPVGNGGLNDLLYSTYFGGTDNNIAHGLGIAVDSSGDAYITGFTQSATLPTTPGAFQGACSKCGSSSSPDDGFVAKISPGGQGATDLVYSTYLGGESYDEPKVIALDSSNDAYIVGRTASQQFPVMNPLQAAKAGPVATGSCSTGTCSAFDGSITELNSTGTGLIFSTFNGGSNFDSWNAVVVDSSGNIYVGGRTQSLDYGATEGVFQPAHAAITGGSGFDNIMAKISPQNTPGVGFGPASLTFSRQAVGTTSSSQAIVLTAAGGATLSISNISVTGTESGDFAETNTCGSSVAQGTNCTISVTFTPTASGTRTASLTVADDATGSPQSIPLTGTGSGAAVSLAPTSLTFVSQSLGTTSAPQGVTLTNTGSSTLTITSISITGTNQGDFGQTNTCGSSVAVGANCTINVTFTPTATGTRTAAVSIANNATGSPQTVSLTGTGASAGNPAASLSPTSLTFPLQVIGKSGTPQVVTLTNTGTGTLSITSISVTADPKEFSETNTCPASLAPGANCTISVTYTAKQSSPPASSGTLSISDNAASSPQTVALSGTGTFVQRVPTSLTFASQPVGSPSAAQTVTLTNTQPNQTLAIAPSITGSNPGDFAETNTCGGSVAPGASCTFSVTFTPTAAGTRSAALSIADAGGGSPQTVTLTGTGAGAPAVTFAPTSLTFAGQGVDTSSAPQSVTLTNTGSAALSITSVSITGANAGDFGQTNTCGTSVAAGASCGISVTFTPATTGPLTASLTIADNAGGGSATQTVALSGTGATAPTAGLSPSTMTFGSQAVGSTSSAQVATLTNTGGSALTISSIGITGPFAKTSTCGSSLAAGASCTVSVTFSPATATATSGTLTVSDNAAGSPQTVTLTGTGITPPGASLSPASIAFSPSQVVGTPSAARTVTLTNTGGGTLTITSLSLTNGSFVETSASTCGTSLAPSAACTIAIEFKPLVAGTISGSLMVADNAPNSPQSVTLTGPGVAAGVGFQPSTGLVFPGEPLNTSSAPQYVTLTNTSSTTALSISSIAITGANASDFSIGSNTCPMSSVSTLAAGGTCKISVSFSPTTGGSLSASLTVNDSAPGSPHSLQLSGAGATLGLTAPTSSATIAAGQPASYALNFAPTGGFSGMVTLSCTTTAPVASCSVKPGTLTLNAPNAATATATVTTTAGGSAPPEQNLPSGPGGWLWWVVAAALAAGYGLLGSARQRARWALAGALFLVLAWAGCGGGGSTTSMGPTSTPAGTYQVTVTANSATVSQNVTLSLTVQ